MQSVLNNPYRVIGVLSGSKSKDIDRQVRRLKAYIDADQSPEDDSSFPVLGSMNRNAEDIDSAAAKINLDHDKIIHSLFWFVNGNEITDEPALEALAIGDLASAQRIWEKHVSTGVINKRTASAYNNYSTLMFVQSFAEDDDALFDSAISLKLEFIESEIFSEYAKHITHDTFSVQSKDIQIKFLDVVKNETITNNQLTINYDEFINVIFINEFEARPEIVNSIIDEPYRHIESRIELTKKKRNEDPKNGVVLAKRLLQDTKKQLDLLEKIDDGDNYRIDSIKDKLSEEILQCGIDYYNIYIDTDKDPGFEALAIVEKSQEIAVGQVLIERISETHDTIKEWVDDAESRDQLRGIKQHIDFIHKELKAFQSLMDTPSFALKLIHNTKPSLAAISNAVGKKDKLYIQLSSAVAGNALGMLVTVVNEAQNNLTNSGFISAKTTIDSAWSVMQAISVLDMDTKLRLRFEENNRVITNIKSTLREVSERKNQSTGCLVIVALPMAAWALNFL